MGRRIQPLLRSAWHLFAFSVILGAAFCRFLLFRKHRTPVGRSLWLQDTCRRIASGIGLDIRTIGPPIPTGLLVSNHLSYLDIIVLGSLHPCSFVSKVEVRSWPVIGWGAQAAGTLFVRRENRADIAAAANGIRDLLEKQISVMVFPEGTSSGGGTVLPFYPGIFESVAGSAHWVTPAWLGYALQDGDPAEEICYWRDMTFVPHFLRLLGKKRITAHVRIGRPLTASGDRKVLARETHARVVALAAEAVRPINGSGPEKVFVTDAVRN